jgi:Protein of unknown function (DUF3426)
MFNLRIARGATCLTLLVGLTACAGTREPSYPIPDEPGLYALTSDDTLHRLDGDREWEVETWPERSNMPTGVEFVVSDPALASRPAGTSIELWKVAWVRSEINANNQAMPIEGSPWAVAPLEPFRIPFRYESPPDQRDVVHIVPTVPLEPGLYALRIVNPGTRQARVGVGWNSVDQRQYSAANCVDRYAAEGYVYRPCTTAVGGQAGTLPPAGAVYSVSPAISPIESGSLGSLSAPAPAAVAAAPAPAPTPAPAPAPQPTPTAAAAQALNIVLVDPVRQSDGLLIQGVVINSSSQPQMVPTMQASLEDQAGQEVRRWVFEPPVKQLAPGQRANFRTEVRPLPAGVARANVAFVSTTP